MAKAVDADVHSQGLVEGFPHLWQGRSRPLWRIVHHTVHSLKHGVSYLTMPALCNAQI